MWKGKIDRHQWYKKNEFKLLGENTGDVNVLSVSFAGDVNSDGIQDFYHWLMSMDFLGVMLCLEKKVEDFAIHVK